MMPRSTSRDRLIARAQHLGLTAADLARRLGIGPDRLNNCGVAEVVSLAMEADDPDWIMHQIEVSNGPDQSDETSAAGG